MVYPIHVFCYVFVNTGLNLQICEGKMEVIRILKSVYLNLKWSLTSFFPCIHMHMRGCVGIGCAYMYA